MLENSVISTAAVIERCANGQQVADSDLHGQVCERRVHGLHDDPQ